jgi:hypothetical protein
MITFNEFVEHKRSEFTIRECATLLAETDVNPYVYIYESIKEVDPVFAEGWWDNVRSAAGNLWQGVRQFGSNVAQGVKAGYNQASDTISGPVAKYDAAVRALDDLLKVLGNDPEFSKFQSKSGQGSVIEYIEKVKQDLLSDKQQVPQRSDTKVSQPYDTRGNVDAARNPEAAQAQQPQAQQQNQAPARTWDRRGAGRM